MKKLLALLTMSLFMSLFWFSACTDDDDNGKEDVGRQEDVADVQEDDVPATGFPNLAGKAFVVTVLEAVEPTDLINETWASDMATYDLTILFYVVSHDSETGKFEFKVTSCAAEKEGEGDNIKPLKFNFALDPSVVTGTLNGTNFAFDEPFELDIMTPTINKPFHLFGLTGTGRFNKTGTMIQECWLEGAIKEDEIFDLCLTMPIMGPVNFHWFMNTGYLCPDFDSDEDGVVDSYKFSGDMAAEETDLFDPSEIVTIVSLVEECPYDDEKCSPD